MEDLYRSIVTIIIKQKCILTSLLYFVCSSFY